MSLQQSSSFPVGPGGTESGNTCIDVRRELPGTASATIWENCFYPFKDCVIIIDMQTLYTSRAFFFSGKLEKVVCGDYTGYFDVLLRHVHPDDRKRLEMLRGHSALLAAHAEELEDISCEFRLLLNGEYNWIASQVCFSKSVEHPQAIILSRNTNIDHLIVDSAGLSLARSANTPLEGYAEIYEIDLANDVAELVFSKGNSLVGMDRINGSDLFNVARILVHPEDRKAFVALLDGTAARRTFSEGASEIVVECRRLSSENNWLWTHSTLVPLRGPNGVSKDKGMLFVRDVSRRKEDEHRSRMMEQYDRALRNIYDEVYELNVSQDTYRILHQTHDKYVSPPESGLLSESVEIVAENMVHPLDRKRFLAFLDLNVLRKHFRSGEEFCIGEFRKLWVDGWYHWASLTLFPVVDKNSGDETYLVFIMDIDARKRSEEIAQQNALLERQRLADERYKIIVEQTNTLVFEWTRDSGTSYASPDLSRRLAGIYDGRDLLTVWREDKVVHPEDMPQFFEFIRDSRSKSHVEMTVRFRRRDNSYIWCKVALTCLRDENDNTTRYIGTLNDVDDATRSVLALRYRAEYDILTGICNMQTFYARASQLMQMHPEKQYCIIRMDIDRFKVINDLYGMEEGDRLLRCIARLLNEYMNEYSVCGRISGDVFCACVDFSQSKILEMVHHLVERLGKYPLTSRVVPSFGICRVDNVETPINVLCDWANLALKTVKGNVLQFHAFYDETLRDLILDEKKIESEMHEALSQGQFCVYLQPKVDICTSRIMGAEALVRWNNPVDGVIAPENFIPLFEKNGFIIRLDEFIWEQTCILLRSWIDRGITPLPLSVNVSRIHIYDTRFCEKLPHLVEKYDLPPQLLELELTESVFLDNAQRLVDAISRLRERGFLFSLDDFGSGYSSLNMLKSLPIETIKIDRGFLNEVVATERGKTVIRHIIALAKDLHMSVVAEGVETVAQADFLREVNCFLAQGYLYSRPVPVSVFEVLAFGPCGGILSEQTSC